MAESLRALPAAVSSVLVSSRTLATDDGDACSSLLTRSGTSEPSVVWVTYTHAPEACVRKLTDVDVTPARGLIVAVGEPRGDGSALRNGIGLETVESPADLTGLGIALLGRLDAWPDGETVVCYDSLTSMLQYVELESAYEFLQVVCGRAYEADALAHFHLDPDAHDRQTVATLTSLFDAAVTVEDDDVAVRSRFDT